MNSSVYEAEKFFFTISSPFLADEQESKQTNYPFVNIIRKNEADLLTIPHAATRPDVD